MIPTDLKSSLDRYINQYFIIPTQTSILYTSPAPDTTKGMEELLTQKEAFTLEHLIQEAGPSFHEVLFEKIDSSDMTETEIYKRANIDRRLFSKIRNNPAYHPRKQTVLALAIALKLTVEETRDLLARAEYALSPSSKGDLIVQFFIEQGIYDMSVINMALDEYTQPVLA